MTEAMEQDGIAGTEPAPLDPSHIMQVGMGFWPSKALLSAVELGVFTILAESPLSGDEIAQRLELRSRAVFDFLDGLVALRLLERDGVGPDARYRNTPETAAFLDANKPEYIGGVLEMSNARLYGFWGGLTEALRTGQPQNEIKHTGRSMFEELYSDPARLEQFMAAMTGISAGNFRQLADKFDFSRYNTVCDVGGATGLLSIILADRHPHLRCTSFDLPVVEPIAARAIAKAGLADRVSTAAGDFFVDALPPADVITMGLILHDWNLERKRTHARCRMRRRPPRRTAWRRRGCGPRAPRASACDMGTGMSARRRARRSPRRRSRSLPADTNRSPFPRG